MKPTCSAVGCVRKAKSRGLCHTHYVRLLRGRDVNTPIAAPSSLVERFLCKLGLTNPLTGCVEWEAGRNRRGYGLIFVAGQCKRAHRVAWELLRGPIPEGLCVCHTCDNPPCCNVEHLFLGTDADNTADKVAKGRQVAVKGEKHYHAKLTENDVADIRLHIAEGLSQRLIATKYGINQTTVSKINRRKNWKVSDDETQ